MLDYPYIPRHAEAAANRMGAQFGAILVTGARQVGKSTMLRKLKVGTPEATTDDALTLYSATQAPELFFAYNPPPLLIDEVQRAPQLFPEVKKLLERTGGKGQVWMTGSDQFELMRDVTESLAGRVGILNLLGLSQREIARDPFHEPFLPGADQATTRPARAPLDPNQVWQAIWRGQMPQLVAHPGFDWAMFYGSYVRTYIERDVRRLAAIQDESRFMAFIRVAAARTGQLLNVADMASTVGISHTAAKRWLSILQTSALVYLLPPWSANVGKRSVKTPKLYFLDTGLAAYLTSWTSPATLRDGAMAGQFLESFAVAEVLRSYLNAGQLDPPVYFYRDYHKREIDLIIARDNTLHPVEVKRTGAPRRADCASFQVLDSIPGASRGSGCVLCLTERAQPITDTDTAVPISWI
ncbi:MAG: ATP-binding protein [Bifidobacteriaceae bacterium]|jgi:predicted AAA+ superfamily ATPase|nr:ATP-binding protein [Bifidobacteriaceae bacterium]